MNFDAFDAHEELFRAVVNELSNQQARLAIWFIEEFDLSQLDYQSIGGESPFPSSGSKLLRSWHKIGDFVPPKAAQNPQSYAESSRGKGVAADGFLISLQPSRIDELIEVLVDRLTFEILHLEIEAKGQVQFAAFDHFCHVLFGDEISLDMLESLKTREVIYGYEVYSNDETVEETDIQDND